MAAVTPPKTTVLGLALNLHGLFRLQKGVKDGFQKIDDEVAALRARLDTLETIDLAALNDSNSALINN